MSAVDKFATAIEPEAVNDLINSLDLKAWLALVAKVINLLNSYPEPLPTQIRQGLEAGKDGKTEQVVETVKQRGGTKTEGDALVMANASQVISLNQERFWDRPKLASTTPFFQVHCGRPLVIPEHELQYVAAAAAA
jgi:hypothetical protein